MFKAATALSLFAFALSAAAQGLIVNTPAGVTQCEPTLIQWSGGTPPYFLDLLSGDDVNGAAIESLQVSVTATSFSWNVDQPGGTSLDLAVRDSNGARANTAVFTVAAAPPGACSSSTSASASSTSSSSSSGSSTSSSSSSKASTTAVVPPPTTTGTTSSSSAAGKSTTTSAASTTTTGSGTTSGTSTVTNSSSAKPASTTTTASSTGTQSAAPANGASLKAIPAAGVIGAIFAAAFLA